MSLQSTLTQVISQTILGKFQKYRYLCEQHSHSQPQVIPLDYSQKNSSSTFIKNLIVNNGSDQKYKMLIESSFKELVKDSMDNYYNEWRKHFLNWKKIIRTQYMGIMNTFDPKTIQRFIQNVINKDEDQSYDEQLNFHAQSMRVSGSRPYNHLDTITHSLIQSYKQLNRIFQEEIKKLNDRNKFIESFLSSKKLEKIKCGNPSNNGITEYVIDDNDDYPEISRVTGKKEEYSGSAITNGISNGINNGATNQPTANTSENSNSLSKVPQFDQNQQVEIDVNIKNYKQIFFTIGNKHSTITKATIRYQVPLIVNQTLQNLSLCNNLEELNIEQPLFGTKEIIIFIVQNFTKLKRLYLNCYNDFDDECAYVVMRQLPHIEKLYWGCNFYKSIARAAELRIWREHAKMKKKVSLRNQTLLSMIKNLKSLQNLWISDLDSKSAHSLFNELKKMPKLRHLSLGQYNVSAEDIPISQDLWATLCQIPTLQSIAFIRVNLNDANFCSFVGKHKSTLRTLVIYKSPGLTDESFKYMKENQFKALKQLYLADIGSRQLQGKYLWDIVQLETLVLRGCQFNHVFAQEKVGKMKNLINLDLKGCQWVSDLLMSSVSKFFKTLEYLNLRNSKITFHTREHINRLTKLKALDIGYTNINQFDIENICETNPNIQKLSLGGLSGSAVLIARGVLSKGKMHVLGKLLKNCTHLDVSACDRLDDTSLDRFLKLQYVNVWNCKGISQNTKQMLRQHGVMVFDKI